MCVCVCVCIQVGFSLEAVNEYMVHVNNVCCFCHRLSDNGKVSSRVVVVVVLQCECFRQ